MELGDLTSLVILVWPQVPYSLANLLKLSLADDHRLAIGSDGGGRVCSPYVTKVVEDRVHSRIGAMGAFNTHALCQHLRRHMHPFCFIVTNLPANVLILI